MKRSPCMAYYLTFQNENNFKNGKPIKKLYFALIRCISHYYYYWKIATSHCIFLNTVFVQYFAVFTIIYVNFIKNYEIDGNNTLSFNLLVHAQNRQNCRMNLEVAKAKNNLCSSWDGKAIKHGFAERRATLHRNIHCKTCQQMLFYSWLFDE